MWGLKMMGLNVKGQKLIRAVKTGQQQKFKWNSCSNIQYIIEYTHTHTRKSVVNRIKCKDWKRCRGFKFGGCWSPVVPIMLLKIHHLPCSQSVSLSLWPCLSVSLYDSIPLAVPIMHVTSIFFLAIFITMHGFYLQIGAQRNRGCAGYVVCVKCVVWCEATKGQSCILW